MRPSALLFTDGASSGNPGPSGWGAIVQIKTAEKEVVTELGGGLTLSTNNAMELKACVEGTQWACAHGAELIEICTDSTYVIQGATRWVQNWVRSGWKTASGNPVEHVSLWEELLRLQTRATIRWTKVAGHSGIPGNERADAIATGFSEHFSRGTPAPLLYSGPAADYRVSLKVNHTHSPRYLSFVSNTLEEHETWDECKRRVEGAAGARYRKFKSDDERRQILQSWGLWKKD